MQRSFEIFARTMLRKPASLTTLAVPRSALQAGSMQPVTTAAYARRQAQNLSALVERTAPPQAVASATPATASTAVRLARGDAPVAASFLRRQSQNLSRLL